MKRIYGCDLWDGFTSVFNKTVGKPLVKGLEATLDYLESDKGQALIAGIRSGANKVNLTKAWNFLSGTTLLSRHDLPEMDVGQKFGTRIAGCYLSAILSFPAMSVLGTGDTPESGLATVFTMALLGTAMGPLPRNAYVACKARKKNDMKHEASGFRPQPPQV